jgi:hypothetical protein
LLEPRWILSRELHLTSRTANLKIVGDRFSLSCRKAGLLCKPLQKHLAELPAGSRSKRKHETERTLRGPLRDLPECCTQGLKRAYFAQGEFEFVVRRHNGIFAPTGPNPPMPPRRSCCLASVLESRSSARLDVGAVIRASASPELGDRRTRGCRSIAARRSPALRGHPASSREIRERSCSTAQPAEVRRRLFVPRRPCAAGRLRQLQERGRREPGHGAHPRTARCGACYKNCMGRREVAERREPL